MNEWAPRLDSFRASITASLYREHRRHHLVSDDVRQGVIGRLGLRCAQKGEMW